MEIGEASIKVDIITPDDIDKLYDAVGKRLSKAVDEGAQSVKTLRASLKQMERQQEVAAKKAQTRADTIASTGGNAKDAVAQARLYNDAVDAIRANIEIVDEKWKEVSKGRGIEKIRGDAEKAKAEIASLEKQKEKAVKRSNDAGGDVDKLRRRNEELDSTKPVTDMTKVTAVVAEANAELAKAKVNLDDAKLAASGDKDARNRIIGRQADTRESVAYMMDKKNSMRAPDEEAISRLRDESERLAIAIQDGKKDIEAAESEYARVTQEMADAEKKAFEEANNKGIRTTLAKGERMTPAEVYAAKKIEPYLKRTENVEAFIRKTEADVASNEEAKKGVDAKLQSEEEYRGIYKELESQIKYLLERMADMFNPEKMQAQFDRAKRSKIAADEEYRSTQLSPEQYAEYKKNQAGIDKAMAEKGAADDEIAALEERIQSLRAEIEELRQEAGKGGLFPEEEAKKLRDTEHGANALLSVLKPIDRFGGAVGGSVVKGLKAADMQANRLGMALKNAVSEAVMKRFKKLNKNVDGSGKSFKRALKNILRYGLGIRSVFVLFNRVRNMVKQGINSIVQFSETADKSISNIVNAFKQFKASVSVAFLPIIQIVEPAITRLINLLARAMNAVAAFFATLSGSTVFVRAKERVDSYAKSLKGAGAAQKYFSGLDEVRTFDNGGGGGGGADSPYKMFEMSDIDAGISEFAKKVKEAWKKADFTEIGEIVGGKLSAAFSNIDLKGTKEKLDKIAKSLATFLNGVANTDLFDKAGEKVAEATNMVFTALRDFASKADFGSWASSIASGLSSAINSINPVTIATAFYRMFNGVNTYITTLWRSIDFSSLGEKIRDGITIAIAGTDFRVAGEAVLAKFNGMLDLVASAVKGFDFSSIGTSISEFFNGMFDSVDQAKLLNAAKTVVSGIGDAIGAALSNIRAGNLISSVGEFAATIIETIAKKMEDNEQVIVNAVADILSGLSKAVKKCSSALIKLGKEIITVIWKGVTQNLSGAFSIGESIVDGIADGIGTSSGVVVAAIGAIATGFITLKTAIAGLELTKASVSIMNFASTIATAAGGTSAAATALTGFGSAVATVGSAILTAAPYIAVAAAAIGVLTYAVEAEKAKEAEWQEHLESVRQEASELPESIQGVVDSLNNEAEAYKLAQEASQGKINSIAEESSHYTNLLEQLDKCVDSDGKIIEGKETLANFIVNQLKNAYGIEIDIVDGVIQKYSEQKQTIQELIAQKKLNAMIGILEEDYGEAVTSYEQLREKLSGINEEIVSKKSERDGAYSVWEEKTKALVEAEKALNEELEKGEDADVDTVMELSKAYDSAKDSADEAKAKLDGMNDALGELTLAALSGKDQLDGYERTLETFTLASELSSKGLVEAAAYVAEHGASSYEEYAKGVMGSLTDAAQAASDYAESVKNSSSATEDEIKAAEQAATDAWKAVEDQYDKFFGAGQYASAGLADGINDGKDEIIAATQTAANDSLNAIKEAYGIASPSKEMADIGMYLDQGLAQGITENENDIKEALVTATEKAMTAMKEKLDEADLDIGKTLKDTNGQISERSDILTSLTDSYTRAASSMKSANNELSKLTDPVLDAADAIKLAGENFSETDTTVTKAAENIGKSVTDEFRDVAEIVDQTFDGMVTKIGDFAFDAQDQWDRGMRKADFGKELIKAINSALDSAETALKGAYTKFYNCGAYIGRGLYNGLVSYKASLIKAMQDVINGIKDTVTVTMKIASPSKVMYKLGEYISEGLANGIGDEGREVLNTASRLSNDTIAQFRDLERIDALQALQDLSIPTPALSYGNIIPPKTTVSIDSLDTIEDKLTAILNSIERIDTSGSGSSSNEYTFNAQINRKVLFSEMIEEAKLSQIKNGKNPFALGW